MTADEMKRLTAYRHLIAGRLKDLESCEDINIDEGRVAPLITEIGTFCSEFPYLAPELTALPQSVDGVSERYYIRSAVVADAVGAIIRIDAELV